MIYEKDPVKCLLKYDAEQFILPFLG